MLLSEGQHDKSNDGRWSEKEEPSPSLKRQLK